MCFLDEAGEATVLRDEGEKVVVVDEDGFEFEYPTHKLVKREWKGVESDAWVPSESARHGEGKKPERGYRIVSHKQPYMEVDLHSHMVLDTERGLSKGEILQAQLDHFRRTLQSAIDKRLKKVVFIHGVGKGVLKEELRKELSHMVGVEFGNADFRLYGGGATEVRIFEREK